MKKQKQLGFEILESKNIKHFGGAYLKNSNPKVKRPITTKRSMHLVLRAVMAKGQYSLLKKDRKIKEIINKQAKFFGIKIYRLANGGNHLHLIVLPSSRTAFNSFIRSISGLIAREVLGAQRGNPHLRAMDSSALKSYSRLGAHECRTLQSNSSLESHESSTQSVTPKNEILQKLRFWDKRPFTRVVEWGREFKSLCNYLEQNALEAWGFIPYQNRKNRFKTIASTA